MNSPMSGVSSSAGKRRASRKVTLAACDTCRAKKSACDALRPQCTKCKSRNLTSPCTYPTEDALESRGAALKRQNESLKQRVQELEQLLHSNGLSASTSTPSSSGVTSSYAFSPASYPQGLGATTSTIFSALPQASFSLEQDPICRHPTAYHQFQPLDFGTIQANFAKVALLFAPLDYRRNDAAETSSPDQHTRGKASMSEAQPRAILRAFDPVRPPKYCDWRLEQLQVRKWTAVEVSNDRAARLFSYYLETDHPILGFFDADLFLDDLISLRSLFCSSLLVNVVLCWACHSYTAFDDQVGPLRNEFYNSAWNYWMHDSAEASAVTASSGLVLNLILISNGKDDLAKAVLRRSYDMAEALDMFGEMPDYTARLDEESINDRRAWSHCAWGLFNHVTQRAFTHQEWVLKYAPKFGIPGNGGVIGYNMEGNKVYHKLPYYVSQTFTHLCRFWQIANQIALNYWSENQTSLQDRISIDWAAEVYQHLLRWSDETTLHDADGQPSPHHCDIFHIHLHSITLDLFRPLLHSSSPPLSAPTANHLQILKSSSLNQLQTHLLLLPTLHPQARMSPLWSPLLHQIANAALNSSLASQENWFFFFLCLSRYQDLAEHFPIMGRVVRGLLGLAIEKGVLKTEEAREVQRRLQGEKRVESGEGGSWLLDLEGAVGNSEGARLEVFAERVERAIRSEGDGEVIEV